jgi:hypothetical protein
MSHPPLCPRSGTTVEVLIRGKLTRFWIHGDAFFDDAHCDRMLVARYQACAWLDRAGRWLRLADRDFDFRRLGPRWTSHNEAYNRARLNTQKWREWERATHGN